MRFVNKNMIREWKTAAEAGWYAYEEGVDFGSKRAAIRSLLGTANRAAELITGISQHDSRGERGKRFRCARSQVIQELQLWLEEFEVQVYDRMKEFDKLEKS